MNGKIIALLLAALMLLSGCSAINISDQQFDLFTESEAQPVEQSAPVAPVNEIRLAYNVNDTLNPYTMKSKLNRELIPLLYDSLVRMDKQFAPENQLATEVTVEGKRCTVKYNRAVQFSDGTLLTGKDILYSVITASSSDTNWRHTLRNVASCAINEAGDVEITLYQEDADFASLLTFPIIKENTAQADFPTGVSKFFLKGMDSNDMLLTANPLYYGETGTIQTIRLVSLPDPNALNFYLKTEEIDLVYSDLSTPEMNHLSMSSVPVALNQMVYLGVNGGRGLLGRAEFRQAISLALNRSELVSNAYLSRANATQYPFHPDFYRMNELERATPRNLTAADALLDGMGLTQKDQNGYRLRDGAPIVLELLVNTENTYRHAAATLISEQLKQIGIQVKVVSKSFSQYRTSLSQYNYDLYIGETRISDNMDISMLFSGGALGFAAPYSEELQGLYRSYKQNGAGMEAFCEGFSAKLPFIPLVFRQGQISFQREFRAEIVATEQDIFYNIVEW